MKIALRAMMNMGAISALEVSVFTTKREEVISRLSTYCERRTSLVAMVEVFFCAQQQFPRSEERRVRERV